MLYKHDYNEISFSKESCMNDIIEKCFYNLISKVRIKDQTIRFIQNKQKGIENQIKRYVKKEWHVKKRDIDKIFSYFAGSYGRGTEIHTSDIDLIVSLPIGILKKIKEINDSQDWWLKEIANSLKQRYTSAKIQADGQVVSVNFGRIKFEILPAFLNRRTYKFIYADTNQGGKWRITDPRSDVKACCDLFNKVGMKYRKMCWLMRCWRNNCKVEISGIIIDCYVYDILMYNNDNYLNYDILCLLFFKKLSQNTKKRMVVVPGSQIEVIDDYKYGHKAEEAYELTKYAILYQDLGISIGYWQMIFGKYFDYKEI